MTTTQDIYVDTESLGSFNSFDVILPHPVIVNDDEKCYICLKDFQQLNSTYNISADLENTTFEIIRTNRTYSRTSSGTAMQYFNPPDLFNTSGTYIYKPRINPAWNGTLHTETITPAEGDYTIKLYDASITTTYTNAPITSVKLSNIFNETATANYMTFNPDDYLVFYNYTTPTSGRFVYDMTFTLESVPTIYPPTETIYVSLRIWSSIDGITWIENDLAFGQSPALGYMLTEWGTAITKTRTFTLVSTDTYSYHKVSFAVQGFTTPATDFKNRIRFKKIFFKRMSSFNETYTDGTALFSNTLEDGAYSLSNLNGYLNYILKTNISPNLTFSNSPPSQTFLVAQNKHILSWNGTEPDFIYSPANKTDENYKIEITFNAALKRMLGWSSANVIIFKTDTFIRSSNHINLINFKKILLTSSLKLTTKPYTFLNKTYTKSTGIGDVFAWISKDIAPFSYINWTNNTDYKIEIDDKLITKISFKILNEFAQVMNNIPACNFHLQIIKNKEEK